MADSVSKSISGGQQTTTYVHPNFEEIMTFNGKRWFSGVAAPTTGTWAQGDVIWNSAPTSGGYMGWVCKAAGTPGTWTTFGAVI